MLVVFGSLNADIIVRVDRRPQPGETVLGDDCLIRPGGKGANQAVAAARAGAQVAMFGAIGTDFFGQQVKERLLAEGVDASGVAIANRATGCATITVDAAGENAICVAPGANAAASAAMVPDSRLAPGTTVLCQMEVPPPENWALLARAKSVGAATVLNLAPADAVDDAAVAAIRDHVDYLILNVAEAGQLAARCAAATASASPGDLASALARSLAATAVVTLGADGAVCAQGEGLFSAPAIAVAVVDTTGAGDAFAGVFAAALDRGEPLQTALSEAAAAGSLACRSFGAQESMPTRADLLAALAGG
jgi:ribokinase